MLKLIANISLIALILLQSVGVTYSRHLCMERVADWKISMTGKKADCGMHQVKPAAHCESEPVMPPMDCCDTEVDHIALEDDIQEPVKASFDLLPALLLIASFTILYHLQKLVSKSLVKRPLPPLLHSRRCLQRLSFLQIFRN